MILKSALKGVVGFAILLLFYFVVLSLISGWNFAKIQFFQNWYWIISLASGFGIQIGIFTYLRSLHKNRISGKMVAASGTASTAAMISCCAHYLVNILPIIGISGLAAILGQYQTEIFLVGVASNLAGIGYLVNKLIKIKRAA